MRSFKEYSKDKVHLKQKQNLENLVPKYYNYLENNSLIVKYSPDIPGKLVSGDDQGKLYIFDLLDDSLLNINYEYKGLPQEIKSQKQIICNDRQASVFDLDWNNQSQRIICGNGDRSISVVDIEQGKQVQSQRKHENSVRVVKSCIYNQDLFISGGRDGCIIQWDMRMKKLGMKLENKCLFQGKAELDSVTGLEFYQSEQTILSTQAGDKNIKLWDLRFIKGSKLMLSFNDQYALNNKMANLMEEIQENLSLREKQENLESKQKDSQNKQNFVETYNKEIEQKFEQIEQFQFQNKIQTGAGHTSLKLSKSQKKLVTGTTNNCIYLFNTDTVSMDLPKKFKGFPSSYYSKQIISPCENFIISSSKSNSIYFWDTISLTEEPFTVKNFHTKEVNSVDWANSLFSNYIASVGDDALLLIWDTQIQQNQL